MRLASVFMCLALAVDEILRMPFLMLELHTCVPYFREVTERYNEYA